METAADGAAALAAIEAQTPDLVLLDLDLPGVGGLGVLETLRADPRWRSLPVVVVAGREDIEAVDRAFAAGATSFVVKPLNWRLLERQLRYALRLAEGERIAAARLARLAAAGAQFIAAALAANPRLKGEAASFARAADAALEPAARRA